MAHMLYVSLVDIYVACSSFDNKIQSISVSPDVLMKMIIIILQHDSVNTNVVLYIMVVEFVEQKCLTQKFTSNLYSASTPLFFPCSLPVQARHLLLEQNHPVDICCKMTALNLLPLVKRYVQHFTFH